MPYIKQEIRDQIDPAIENLLIAMMKTKVEGKAVLPSAGWYNYVITTLLNMGHATTLYPNYDDINTIMGILESVKQEFYRRVAAPYEDKKVTENGDVY
jgi:hypothetical protein